MLTSIKATIKRLIDEGNGFTYENFSEKGPRGYPSVIKSEYEAWYLKVASFFHENFDDNHPLRIEYDATSTGMLLGNGPQYFEQTQSEIIGALTAALDVNYKPNNTDVPTRYDPKKVFIVHGHDNKLKEELNSFLLSLKLQPIILHRQADEGQTVIEKFEKHSNVGYSFILLTPDDLSKERRLFGKKKFRARQNVIFEFGFFVGKLERKRVCCLYKEGVELPTDVSGMIYKPVKSDIESVGLAIIRDLRAAGYSVDVPE